MFNLRGRGLRSMALLNKPARQYHWTASGFFPGASHDFYFTQFMPVVCLIVAFFVMTLTRDH